MIVRFTEAIPALGLPRVYDRWTPAGATRALLGALVVAALAIPIAVLEPYYLAGAVGGGLAALIIICRPALGIAMLLFAVPFGGLAELSAGDFTLSITEPLVALLGISWFMRGVRRRHLYLGGGPILLAALPFTLLAVFSITYAESVGGAVKESLKWLEMLIVIAATVDLGRQRRALLLLLGALFLAGGIEALWGIGQAVSGSGPAVFALGGALRAFGHFNQPNPFAGYLATILPLAAMVAIAPGFGRIRGLAALASVLMVLAVFLSQSRGSWLGLGITALVLMSAWSTRSRRALLPVAFAGLFLVLLVVSGLLPGSLVSRLSQTLEYFGVFDVRTVEVTGENWSIVERMAHWQAAWYMFQANPWLGVGAGNYATAYPSFYVGDWLDPLGHAHNYYLNTLAELGLLGLILLLVFLGTVFRLLGKALFASASHDLETHRAWRPILAGVFGALVVFAIHNLFDNLLVHSINVQLAFLVGVGLVAAERLRAPVSRHLGTRQIAHPVPLPSRPEVAGTTA